MPIYEFSCKKCEKTFEELIQSKEETVVCPSCGNDQVEKMLSIFGVQGEPSLPCEDGSCGIPGQIPPCGEGACPSCLD